MADFLRRYDDEGGLRLHTLEELEDYCWYVAGTVGELFTNLLDCYGAAGPTPDPEDARSFALLLQLVNIAKDVRADYETENNVYLPAEWLAEEGLDHAAVGDPDRAPGVARVVRRLTDHAAAYAPGARRYLDCLPEGQAMLLEAMGMPYLLALGTVRELRGRSREAVDRARTVKLRREEVEALLAEAESGLTQAELSRLAERVRAGPYHRSDVSV
jgi:farnesyl-diphosphate farnesyltransferase